MRLSVDPKYPEQMVRGTVVLPFGTGKVKRVLVIAAGEKQKEATEAGADFVGGDEIVEKIQKENWFEYDVVISTPDMMKSVGRLGKALGTKGLMPSPKAGTVTFNVKDTVAEIKKGRVEFRVDKAGIIHSSIAKTSFDGRKDRRERQGLHQRHPQSAAGDPEGQIRQERLHLFDHESLDQARYFGTGKLGTGDHHGKRTEYWKKRKRRWTPWPRSSTATACTSSITAG